MRVYKRTLAGICAGVMLTGVIPSGFALPEAAAAAAKLGLSPAYSADVNAKKFTHNEWTGKNGTEDVFAVNREPASVTVVDYQSEKAAANAVWDYNAREDSDYLQMLTGSGGDWQLTEIGRASCRERV